MKPVFVFRHIGCEGPGYLADFLEARGIAWRLFPIDEGAEVPRWPVEAGALVFMGGSMSVNDPLPWIGRELELIRAACAAGLPVLGHCLGAQLIARALGGEVGANPVKEIGWFEVETVESPPVRGLVARLPRRFEGFHWHGETFSLPAGAAHLMSSRHCAHQAFVHGSALGLQFHVEVTGPMVRQWVALSREELERDGGRPAVQRPAQILEAAEARAAAMQPVADVLYEHWLSLGAKDRGAAPQPPR
jgi:GMP synthase-like glutamine amidotransferase